MKSIVWFILGVFAGFFAAHQFNKTQKGKRCFESFDQKTREFTQAITDAYRQREAELQTVVAHHVND